MLLLSHAQAPSLERATARNASKAPPRRNPTNIPMCTLGRFLEPAAICNPTAAVTWILRGGPARRVTKNEERKLRAHGADQRGDRHQKDLTVDGVDWFACTGQKRLKRIRCSQEVPVVGPMTRKKPACPYQKSQPSLIKQGEAMHVSVLAACLDTTNL